MIRRTGLLLLAWMLPGLACAEPSPRFPAASVWHQRIDQAPLHPQSASMINMLQSLGGWGASTLNGRMHIDFSFHVARATMAAPTFEVVAHKAYDEYYLPDCEALGARMPVPAGAAFEGESGLACDNTAGDCHLLVVQGTLLYELYAGNLADGDDAGTEPELDGMCLAVWDLARVYPEQGRGEHCTSADAAGFPIAPLLPNPDGIAAALLQADGDLGHAIRFILPNARMASDAALGGIGGRLYVRPATHAGSPSGPATSVPYGARLRLRADFDMGGYNAAARVVLRTMQRYGIVLADGGTVALTFESDRHTATSWDALGIGSQTFWNGANGSSPVAVTDFEVIDTGARIAETWECVRTAIVPGEALLIDGFEG